MTFKKTVLVVDDNAINVKILTNILSNDYNILTAENGLVAMNILMERGNSISIILLDLIMPVMNGEEFLIQLNKKKEYNDIPVIVMTLQTDNKTEVRILSLGVTDFLAKPYRAEIIKHKIANAIKFRETASFVNTIEKDDITNLYNKKAFIYRGERYIQNNYTKKLVLIAFDIEKFKLFNEMFGVREGDNFLGLLGKTIEKFTLGMGYPIGRLNADIFTIIAPHDETFIMGLYDAVYEAVNKYKSTIDIIVDCGVYYIDNSNLDVQTMCDRAQIAISTIKNNYTKRIAYYESTMSSEILDEQEIVGEMRAAVDEKQLEIYYQPKVNLKTLEITGAEALVRWNHPTRGFIVPDTFIPIFERNGFITTMDKFVWEETCITIKELRDNNIKDLPISINVSRNDMYMHNIDVYLEELVKKYDLSSECLPLEITETSYTENTEQLLGVIRKLKDKGFMIEMDDFGSGYSSLNMISTLTLDVLKLDMLFMRQFENNISNDKIISFVVNLANWLGYTIIVEGIETREQAEYLAKLNCQYGQGYYFSKPVNKADFIELIKKNNKEMSENKIKKLPKPVDIVSQEDIWTGNSNFMNIFNTFVLPMCIIQVYKGKIEILNWNKALYGYEDSLFNNVVLTEREKLRYALERDLFEKFEEYKEITMEENKPLEYRHGIKDSKDVVHWIKINFQLLNNISNKCYILAIIDEIEKL